jgi:hypothetical protein
MKVDPRAVVREVHDYDTGRQIKGCKRHVAVDIVGLVLSVVVHAPNLKSATRTISA